MPLRRLTRPFALLALLLAASALPAHAQGTEPLEAGVRHSLREDAWALQFRVGESFSLHSFSGATISAKHHYRDWNALRYGLTVNGTTGDGNNQQSLVFGAEYLVYPSLREDPNGAIHLFYGGGPAVEFSREHDEFEGITERTQSHLGVGVTGAIGAEWFVRPRISLSAEYRSVLMFRRTRVEMSEREPATSNAFMLTASGVRFGASVYF